MVDRVQNTLSVPKLRYFIQEFLDLCDRIMDVSVDDDESSLRCLLRRLKDRTEEFLAQMRGTDPARKVINSWEEREMALLQATLYSDERKRRHVASRLQDEVSQNLSFIRMLAENASELVKPERGELSDLLERISEATLLALSEVENIIDKTRPPILDILGVTAALSYALRKFREANPGIHVVQRLEVDDSKIPDPLKTDIFRVAQSLMKNVSQHSRADGMEVSLTLEDGCLELRIEDNGTDHVEGGAVTDGLDRRGAGSDYAILVTQARLRVMGGYLEIRMREGRGMCAVAVWPLAV